MTLGTVAIFISLEQAKPDDYIAMSYLACVDLHRVASHLSDDVAATKGWISTLDDYANDDNGQS